MNRFIIKVTIIIIKVYTTSVVTPKHTEQMHLFSTFINDYKVIRHLRHFSITTPTNSTHDGSTLVIRMVVIAITTINKIAVKGIRFLLVSTPGQLFRCNHSRDR